ncbi:hypothetical protein HWI79_3749 [Cryptosporidium felis]|nr:hypothetical protein HWI79_3749 [Cryptosporidium felis]
MRKVNLFFNSRPFSDSLTKESVECTKELAEKMMDYLDSFESIVAEKRRKCWQAIDYKLVRPLIGKINNFSIWLETSGVMEIPDALLKEYKFLISLTDDSKLIEVDLAEENPNSSEEFEVAEVGGNKEMNIEFLITDINSNIIQTKNILNELEKFGKILDEKKTLLENKIKVQQIVEVFSPIINDLKVKYSKIINEGTLENFQELINEFCIVLEERNELRYRLVYGESEPEKPIDDENIGENIDSKIHSGETVKPQSCNKEVICTQEKNKRYTTAVDKQAMKLFARWSLPDNPIQ